MGTAVHFFATEEDERLLLDTVWASRECLLFPSAKMDVRSPIYLDRRTLGPQNETHMRYGILDPALGDIAFVTQRPTLADVEAAPRRFKSLAFKAINWDVWKPVQGEGIIDWDHTPALFWERGRRNSSGALLLGSIGSQAAAMEDISHTYRLWVDRVMAWVRRRGVKVAQDGKPTQSVDGVSLWMPILNAVFALPDAMRLLMCGVEGRLA